MASVATVLVDRATSDMLIGPDWAMNIEICDVLNNDPGQAKDVIKVLKRRINSKNPKIQLLALTVLETVIKNCGDIVHMHVAEKDVLHEMVKIVKKKPDFRVKEKILVLVDTWQEAFGGPRARYPQYYAAYQELLRLGVVFPQRSERSVPIFTPPQTHPLSNYPPSLHRPEYRHEPPPPESSARTDLPSLNLTDIQNARGIMDVLAEMLNALDPANKEGLKQEVIVDLVDQCRSYKQRVVQLVNTTSDEELLRQGLALNDDLQRVLGKRDAMAAGIVVPTEKQKTPSSLVHGANLDIKAQTITKEPKERSSTETGSSSQSSLQQLLLPAPPSSGGSSATPAKRQDPLVDLLSGDFNPPANENPLALVPVNQPSTLSPSDQNVLAFSDMFSQNLTATATTSNPPSTSNSSLLSPPQVYPPTSETQIPQSSVHPNGVASNLALPQYQQLQYTQGPRLNHSTSTWNGQTAQSLNLHQQPGTIGTNDHGGGALPPPPWEISQTDSNQLSGSQPQQIASNLQLGGIYLQQTQNPRSPSGNVYPQQPQSPQSPGSFAFPMQNGQMAAANAYPMMGMQMVVVNPQPPPYRNNQFGGFAYAQQPGIQYQYYDQSTAGYPYMNVNDLQQRIYGLQMQDPSNQMSMYPSYEPPTASALSVAHLKEPAKPSRPEDKLFGDLVDFAKSKPSKTSAGKTGAL